MRRIFLALAAGALFALGACTPGPGATNTPRLTTPGATIQPTPTASPSSSPSMTTEPSTSPSTTP